MRGTVDIEVREAGRRDGAAVFAVTVTEGGSRTSHEVRVPDGDLERLGGGQSSGTDLVRRAFVFLLEREPKESILSSFDIMTIARYYPEFPERIRGL